MPSLTLPDRVIWFAHCPKAGGTSVEQFMVARWGKAVGHLHWGWDLWWRAGGWRLADPPNSPQHLVWADALDALPARPDMVFALVRDPVARMASEYRWQRQGRRGTRLGKALAHLPFSMWLRLMLAAARINAHLFDNHFRPQGDFVPEDARVFRLEDGLAPVIAWLGDVTGEETTEPPPHAIATGQLTRIGKADKALIAHTFAVDYDRFGYPRPDAAETHDRLGPLARRIAPVIALLDRQAAL